MLAALPLLAYLCLFSLFCTRRTGLRAAALHSATAWGALVVAITELLSLFHTLTSTSIAMAWLSVDAALGIDLLRRGGLDVPLALARERITLVFRIPELDRVGIGLLLSIGMAIALVGMVAVLSPPNTWDAMVYHMPRIVHWLQDRTVAFYPTHIPRQLHMPPGAEFIVLQVHALAGTDRFDNLVQWFSFAGSVAGVTLVARCLGAGLRGQVLAAVLCATIPQGILEASGSKNDCVLSFWLLALSYYLLAFAEKATYRMAFGIGAALGLACLTKGTAYVFAPAILGASLLAYSSSVRVVFAKYVPILVLVAGVLNAGHFARNFGLYGSPIGPGAEGASGEYRLTNDSFAPSAVASNILRNIALHFATPSSGINALLSRDLRKAVEILGSDADDPATTWAGARFEIIFRPTHEALAGNPLHLLLIGCALVLAVFVRQPRALRVHAAGLTFAFLLFCTLFKWQPWHTRLHLPLFVLWSPLIATIVTRSCPTVLTNVLAVVLLAASVPALAHNDLRPLIGNESILRQDRLALYFTDNKSWAEPFAEASRLVGTCDRVGLDLASNDYEYPLLVFLAAGSPREVRHINVQNASAHYAEGPAFSPCAVFCTVCSADGPPWQREKYDAYRSQGMVPRPVENAVVFVAARRPEACSFALSAGWHQIERSGGDWLRWTDGRGQVRVVVTQDSEVTLSGEIMSAQGPNDVDVLVNGEKVRTLKVDWPAWTFRRFEPVTLRLRKGENLLELLSHNPAITIPTDSRPLAIAVRNLAFAARDRSFDCTLEPR